MYWFRSLWALLLIIVFLVSGPTSTWAQSDYQGDDSPNKRTEADYNKIYCDSIGGQTEVRHDYTTDAGETSYVIVDCETDTEVIEGGLDKRSSLDSIQQALFFAFLTGKKPVVVIYDTDGIEGKIEYRIKIGAAHAGVGFTKSRMSGLM